MVTYGEFEKQGRVLKSRSFVIRAKRQAVRHPALANVGALKKSF